MTKYGYLKRIGDIVGQYQITAYLGRGHESDVYRVRDWRHGTERSLKLLRGRGDHILTEAKSAAEFYRRLSHCVSVKRYRHMGTLATQSGVGIRPYLVFDYIAGETVERHCAVSRRLPPGLVLAAICQAVARVHRAGLAIGDFDKGRNVLIESVTHRVVFCDLDWGVPGKPNQDQFDDLVELRKLGHRLFKLAEAKPDAELISVLDHARTVTEASRLLSQVRSIKHILPRIA